MTSNNCLNCGKELTDKYCSGCGQKADTHRITFKNFVFHDLLHGTFHLERGIFFTAKEALIRPGKAALDYIAGKRKRYYNVFLLILLAAGLLLFVRHFYIGTLMGEPIEEDYSHLNQASQTMSKLVAQKGKIIILLFVPLAALNSLLLFRRKKLNYPEHAILSGMILLGMILFSLFGNLFFYLNVILPFSDAVASAASMTVVVLTFIYIGFAYINAFASDYTKLGMLWRILMFYLLILFEILVLFIIAFGVASNWEFGRITFNL
jgi:hypothetical protein